MGCLEWIMENKEWLFSGVGVAFFVALIRGVKNQSNKQVQKGGDGSVNIQVGGDVNIKKGGGDD